MAIENEEVDNFVRRSFIKIDPNRRDFIANHDYVLDVEGFVPGLLAQQ